MREPNKIGEGGKIHSALFHGLTKEEKIANAEKAVEESLKKKKDPK